MKLLVVCQYYYPENFQVTPVCEQLARDGYDVTVLTGLPNYPTGVVPPEYRTGHRDEVINGVHVIRCREIGRKKGLPFLVLNYLSYCFSSTLMANKLPTDFDAVLVYQLSPVFMALAGQKYARKRGVPLCIYCCDIWPESLKVYIKSERNPLFRVVKYLSKRLYQSAQRIICQSPSFIPYFREEHGIPKERLSYIPAFADETYLSQDFTPRDRCVDFVFMGNLGIAQNLEAVLDAITRIQDVRGFKVHFVGDGSCLNQMKKDVKERGLENIVVFYGRRPVEDMPEFYCLADACLISLKADSRIGLTLPTKLQGYMAAGKPVLGMIDGSAREVIEKSGCGMCVSADDVAGFADVMRTFILNPEKFQACGEKGRQYFRENFGKAVCMRKLEEEINRLGDKNHVYL